MSKSKKAYKIKFLAALLLSAAVFGLSLPAKVYAASVCIEFSAPGFIVEGEEFSLEINMKASEVIGSVNATFVYNESVLEYVSGPECVAVDGGKILVNDNEPGASNGEKNYYLTFLARRAGECEFYALDKPLVNSYTDNTQMAATVLSLDVIVRATSELSGDASLAEMDVFDLAGNAIALSPVFNSDTYDYGAKVPFGTTKIVIVAVTNDRNANVEVSGESGLKVGSNAVKVIVSAENGDKKVYTVLVIRDGLDSGQVDDSGIPHGLTPTPAPTKESINIPVVDVQEKNIDIEPGVTAKSGKHGVVIEEFHTYTSVTSTAGLKIPDGFTQTSLYIDSLAVTAYESPDLSYELLLVPLQNEAGEIKWYIYDRIEKTFQRLNDAEVKYVNVTADYNDELLETVEDYEKKQKKLLIITGVFAAGFVIILILFIKNLFTVRNKE